MYCRNCGKENPDQAQVCSGCGAQLQAWTQPTQMPPIGPPRTSPMAIWSLVLAISGLVTCGLGAIAGLILGVFGLKQIKDNPRQYTGSGLATAGIVISVVMFLVGLMAVPAAILVPVFSRVRGDAQGAMCINHVKELAMSARIYSNDYDNTYPPAATWCDATRSYGGGTGLTYQCPSALSLRSGYAINSAVAGQSESIVTSNEAVLFFESDQGWNASGQSQAMIITPRHRFISVSCVDGHAIKVFPGYQGSLRWSP